jgi:hypothetical protein
MEKSGFPRLVAAHGAKVQPKIDAELRWKLSVESEQVRQETLFAST